MKTFFDSSALVKRYVEEAGSRRVDEICQATSALAVSIICIPEIMSALNRRLREKVLTKRQYAAVKSEFLREISDTVLINLTPSVIARSTDLLEKNVLRGMDALHVACAKEWEAELFVSSDKRQIEAAKKSGLNVALIA